MALCVYVCNGNKKYVSPGKAENCIKDLTAEDLMAISSMAHSNGYLQDSTLLIFNCSVMTKWLPGTAVRFPGIEILQLYNPHAAVMCITSTPLPDKQDMLGMLTVLEWMSVTVDINSRLCSILNRFSSNVTCPAPKFFTVINTNISIFSKGAADITSFEEANALLDELTSQDVISEAQIKEPEEIRNPSVLVDPVKELELKRLELLQTVSWLQYSKEMDQSKKVFCYPAFSDLEYRFVEELAALRKSCEMGQQKAAQRLVQLLSFRYNRMVTSFQKWRAGENNMNMILFGDFRSHEQFFTSICNLKSKIMAVLVQLRSIFSSYLSPLQTTHPFSETSECLLLRLLEVLINNNKSGDGMFPSIYLYCSLTFRGLSYLEQLLDDCIEVWSVPEFYTNPICVPKDVFSHAELVHVALSQLHLTLVERLPFIDSYEQARKMLTAYTHLVKAATLVRVGVLDSKNNVLGEVVALCRATCRTLTPFAILLKEFKPSKDGWRGYSKKWMLCLKFARNGSVAPFFQKIQFEEFVSKVNVISKQSGSVEMKIDNGAAVATNQQKSSVCSKSRSGVLTVDATSSRSAVEGKESAETENTRTYRAQNHGKGKKHKKGFKSNCGKLSAETQVKSEETGIVTSLQNLHLSCCFGCQKMEQNSETFMKCEVCISDKWTVIRVYCSSDCRVADWERRHAAEHRVGERESDYAGQGLDID